MPMLCYFLLSEAGSGIVCGKSVLELGAGIGVPGLIAGAICDRLTLTDFNPAVLALLRTNLNLNYPGNLDGMELQLLLKLSLSFSRKRATICSVVELELEPFK